MALNPMILGLLAQQAGTGVVGPLASALAQEGGVPPTTAPAPPAFPAPPQGGGIPQGLGVPGPRPSGAAPSLVTAPGAPQVLGAAPPSPVSPTSPGGILPGGSPGGPAPGGVNPLEALVPPTPGAQQQIPQAGRPGLGGSINPQIMQLILQALSAGQQPQQPAQSLGQILGQLR